MRLKSDFYTQMSNTRNQKFQFAPLTNSLNITIIISIKMWSISFQLGRGIKKIYKIVKCRQKNNSNISISEEQSCIYFLVVLYFILME